MSAMMGTRAPQHLQTSNLQGLQPGAPWPRGCANSQNTSLAVGGGSNGAVRWSISINAASAAVGEDGTLYMGAVDHNFYAIDPDDGTTIWSYAAGNDIQGAPAIATDGTIYFGSSDSSLYALNDDGTLDWSYATSGAIIATPAIATDGTIYIGNLDCNFYAINADGTLQWTVALGGSVGSSAAIDGDGVVYFGCLDDKVYALNPDGTTKWTVTATCAILSSPSIGADGTIYIGSEGKQLIAINPDGTMNWALTLGDDTDSSPAIAPDGTIYIGSDDGNLYAVNPDGTQKWTHQTSNIVSTAPAIGLDGTVYVTSTFGTLTALNPDGTVQWVGTTGGTPSSPAIGADGTVYVGGKTGLTYAFGNQVNTVAVASLSFSPDTVIGGTSVVGTVTLASVAPAGGDVVYVTSPNSAVIPSAVVTVAEGETTATFSVATGPVATDTTVTVSASSGGATVTSDITVQPAVFTGFSLEPSTVYGIGISVGTLTLSGPAPDGGFTVAITNEKPSLVSVPGSVTILAGHSTGSFDIYPIDDCTAPYTDLITTTDSVHTFSATLTIKMPGLQATSAWPKFRADQFNTGLAYGGGSNGTQRWTISISASPAVFAADGTIYTGSSDSKLYALNPDGSTKWTYLSGGGIDGSPAIGSDGTVYFGSDDNKLYALNPDGTLKWSYATDGAIVASPAIAEDETIYFGSFDGKFYALNNDGTLQWTFGPEVGSTIYGSAAIGEDGSIYFGDMDLNVYALNPDGTLQWSYLTGWNVSTSPAIGFDGTIYFTSQDDNLYAFNPDGTIQWQFVSHCGGETSPAIGEDGTIYLGDTDGYLYAINPNGTSKWTYTTGDSISTDVAIGIDGTIYVCTSSNLLALSPEGALLWTEAVALPTSPSIGPDGAIFVGSGSGTSYMIGTQVTTGALTSISAAPATIPGGRNTIGYVTLAGPAPAGGDVVYLWSSSDLVYVPPFVIVASGQTTASFPITTYTVSSDTPVTVSGKSGGVTKTTTVNVSRTYILSVSLTPSTLNGEMFTIGLITLVGPAASGGHTLTMTSQHPTLVSVPSTVTVPEGSSSILFFVELLSAPTSSYTNVITAADQVWGPTATLTVNPQALQYGSPWPKMLGSASNTGLAAGGGSNGLSRWSLSMSASGASFAADGTIYVGSPVAVGGNHYLYALNPDGTTKWTFATDSVIPFAPAIGFDGTVYAVAEAGHLYAVHPNGTQKWRFDTTDNLWSGASIGADGTIYFCDGDDVNFYAINPNGTQKWIATTGNVFGSCPGIAPDGTIYSGDLSLHLWAINPDGTIKWSIDTDAGVYSSPSVALDGTIYAGWGNNLYAINPDGTQKWTYAASDLINASAAIGPDGSVYFGSLDENVYALNSDGTHQWTYALGARVLVDLAIGLDGAVYACGEDGTLVALNPDGTVQWTDTLGASPSSPAIRADGSIFVGSTSGTCAMIGTQVNTVAITSVTLSAPTVTGGSTVTGTITLASAAPVGGNVVYITTTDEELIVPAVVTVAGSATTANFIIGATAVDFETDVTIIASTGGSSATVDILIEAPQIVSLTLTPSTVCSRSESVATVTLNGPAPADGWTVGLENEDPDMVGIPPYVTVAAGESTATFIVSAYHLYAVTATDIITAADPSSDASATLTVSPQGTQVGAAWPAPRANSFGTGFGIGGGSNGSEKWTIPISGTSCVIAANGTLYTGSVDNSLHAISSAGAGLWTYAATDAIEGAPVIGADGTIYFGSVDMKLYAVNPDGTLKWSYLAAGAIQVSPVIALDGTVYFGCADSTFKALNPDGTLLWSYTTAAAITNSSPAIATDGTIYFGNSDLKLYSINPGGTLNWTYLAGGALISSPAVALDGTIYIGSEDHYLYAINQDGTLKWKFLTQDAIDSSPSIGADGTIYVGSNDQYVYSINPSGTQNWVYPTGGAISTAPAIGSDGVIYVTSSNNSMVALNPDGTAQWTVPVGSQPHSPAIGFDGTVYVFSQLGSSSSVGTESTSVPLETVSLGRPSVIGGQSVWANMYLSAYPAASGNQVLVSSSNRAAKPPAFFTFVDNQQDSFKIDTLPVSDDICVTITIVAGGVTSTLELNIQAPLVSNLTIDESAIMGGGSATGTVTLSGNAPVGGTVVLLDTEYPDLVETPPVCIVPEGSATATFPITTFGVYCSPVTNVIAAILEDSYQTVVLTVNTYAAALVTLNPSTIGGGETSTGGVVLWSPAPSGGRLVNLLSQYPTYIPVPASVTVLEGHTSVSFTITPIEEYDTKVGAIIAEDGISVIYSLLTVIGDSVSNLTVSPSTIGGNTTSVGTVTLSSAAPEGGWLVNLTSQYPSYVSVPASIRVPAGSTSATFVITPIQDYTSSRLCVISASDGLTSRSANLTVIGDSITSVTLSPTSIGGGETATGTVHLTAAAPLGGWLCTLTSQFPNYIHVPVSITIPQGATSGDFVITPIEDYDTKNCFISAYDGHTTHGATLTVIGDSISSVTLSPSTIGGNTTSTGTVHLSAAAPDGGWLVNLGSQYPTYVSVPATVRVPSGSTTADFVITPRQDYSTRVCNISATDGPTLHSANLTVVGDSVSAISLSPSTIGSQQSSTATVTLSAAAPLGGWLLTLTAQYPAYVTVPATVTVPAGATTVTFPITARVNFATLVCNIAASDGVTLRSTNLTVHGSYLATVSLSPASIVGAAGSTGTVTLAMAAPAGGWTVNLTSANPSMVGVPATVTVPQGSTSATFAVTSTVSGSQYTVLITGTDSYTTHTALLTVRTS